MKFITSKLFTAAISLQRREPWGIGGSIQTYSLLCAFQRLDGVALHGCEGRGLNQVVDLLFHLAGEVLRAVVGLFGEGRRGAKSALLQRVKYALRRRLSRRLPLQNRRTGHELENGCKNASEIPMQRENRRLRIQMQQPRRDRAENGDKQGDCKDVTTHRISSTSDGSHGACVTAASLRCWHTAASKRHAVTGHHTRRRPVRDNNDTNTADQRANA